MARRRRPVARQPGPLRAWRISLRSAAAKGGPPVLQPGQASSGRLQQRQRAAGLALGSTSGNDHAKAPDFAVAGADRGAAAAMVGAAGP